MSFVDTLKNLFTDTGPIRQMMEEKRGVIQGMLKPEELELASPVITPEMGIPHRKKDDDLKLVVEGIHKKMDEAGWLPRGSEQPQAVQPMSFGNNQPSQKYVFRTQDKQPMPSQYEPIVDQAAQTYGINPLVLVAMLSNESGHTWDPNLEGDNGNAVGLSQITSGSFWKGEHHGGMKFNSEEEYRNALRDPVFSINEGARILKHKIDAYGEGDEYVGLMRYNGAGPMAEKYAQDGFRRVGLL